MTAKEQNKKLADYIMANFPEDIVDGGAGDVAILIMGRLMKINAQLLIALQALGSFPDGYCFGCSLEQAEAGHTGECIEACAAIAAATGENAEMSEIWQMGASGAADV